MHHEGGNMAEAKKATKVAEKKKVAAPKAAAAKKVAKKETPKAAPKKSVAKPKGVSKASENVEKVVEPAELTAEPTIAKAGKRSAKSIAEAEEKQAKEERKAEISEGEGKTQRKPEKPARSKLERRSKKFKEAAKLIEKDKDYNVKEALELAIKTSTVKFDATVELHVNLDVDPKQADQNIRGNVTLPSGSGKTVRVAVFVESDQAADAKKAGADIAGVEDISKLLDKETLDFDVLISPPTLMSQLGKYARLLGPRGLMPNPKSGTVTTDIKKAIAEAKAGRVEYRVDSTGIVHLGIGKVSFGADKLALNAEAVLGAIRGAKPASLKGNYVKSVFVTSTMGPSVRLSTTI